MAQNSFQAGDYPTAAEAALRGLQETIDAHAAREGFHFHDDYPCEGWAKRIEWIRKKDPILEDALQRFVEAFVLGCAVSDFQSIRACIKELEGFLSELSPETGRTVG